MPSAALMPNTNTNPATFPGDVLPKQLCFGQLTLMRESKLRFWASRSVVATKVAKSSGPSLANVWREVQGSNYWEDLVEPLDPLLRHEIIRYGEFVTACYKAFDLDPSSKRYLNCKYGRNKMLGEVGLGDSGYQITKYIYATPDITSTIPIPKDVHRFDCGRWIGYVAVSSKEQVRKLGRRDILVTFRGTVTNTEWIANLMSWLIPARLDPHNTRPDVMVEAGFLSLYTSDESSSKFGVGSCRQQLLSQVSKLLKKYKGEEISITLAGHSMGSSLALLLAYDIAELGINIIRSPHDHDDQQSNRVDHVVPVTVFSFAGPRVGNSGFKQRCQELGVKVLRIVNVNDPITKLPGVFFNENFRVLGYEFPWSYSCYAHVGVELALGFFKMQNLSSVHDLETYISLLRLPKGLQIQRDQGIGFFINGVKDSLLSAQYINAISWKNAACTLINMIRSQRACFFLD